MVEEQNIVLNHTVKSEAEDRQIDIRSDEVQEILTHIPNSLIRWGITVIFLAILMLLLVSWLIKYPDTVTARVSITTENPPIPMIARSAGKLRLLINKEQPVRSGQDLAVIENPADIHAVFALRASLTNLKSALAAGQLPESLPDFDKEANLGDLQDDFSAFAQDYLDYRFFLENGYHARKIASIERQISNYKLLNQELVDQKRILSREAEIARENYQNNQKLFDDALISNAELTGSESAWLQKKYALENAEATMINHNIQLSEHQKTIMDLQQQYFEQKRALDIAIQETFKRLETQLASWEQQYLLKAAIDGRVSFFKFWSDNQFVNIGDEVMMIVPDSRDILGKILLPTSGSGKVKTGQNVRIKFDSYPSNEFGVVEGKVESISLMARDSQYLINVALTNGLKTSYDKELQFRQEMQGTADIITEDLRVFDRIFNQLRFILTNNVVQ